MNRQISQEENIQLMDFCKRKGVDFLDLRIEIADHLAHAIVDYWATHPEASFEQALQVEYRKFGIFGFTDVCADYSNRMLTKYGRVFLKELQVSLSVKFVGLILFGGVLFFQLLTQVSESHIILEWLTQGFIIGAPILVTLQYFKNKRIIKGAKLLLLNTPFQYTIWFNYFIFMGASKTMDFQSVSEEGIPVMITLLMIVITLFYRVTFRLQKKAKNEIIALKLTLSKAQVV